MKKIITLMLILFSISLYSQNKKDAIKINELQKDVRALKDSFTRIKTESTYELQKDLLEIKHYSYETKKKYDKEYDSLFAKFLTYWITWISAILLAIASFFGYRKFISEYKKRIEKEVQTRVKTEVDILVPKEVSKITQSKIDILKKEYRQFEKHTRYREEAKILIINEGTTVPKAFDKVMNLFKDADGSDIDRKSIPNLSDLEKHYDLFSQYDLLVIENHIVKNWVLDNRKVIEKKEKLEKELEISKSENKDLSKLTDTINDLDKQITFVKNNNKALVDLADNICHKTAIVYKGLGQFPVRGVKDRYVHMITFANAFSQLYGNILSMLKFVNELDNA